jgi:hypothetical protein
MKPFTLPLLNLVTPDKEVQGILNKQKPRQKLSFVRKAILNFAIDQGYQLPNDQPVYVSTNKWQKVQEAKNKHRSVDYSYVLAYFWLKSLFLCFGLFLAQVITRIFI